MNHWIKIALITITISFSSCPNASDNNGIHYERMATMSRNLDEYFSTLRDLGTFNGSVYFFYNNKEVLRRSYNVALEQSDLFVSTESQFAIQSVSKLLAHVVVLLMEQEGKLDRTDLVQNYFPDFDNEKAITIQHLLDHQSGLPRELSIDPQLKRSISPFDLVDYISDEVLHFDPGTSYLYSNLGYQLLFSIVSKIERRSFELVLQDLLFDKLAMKDTGGFAEVSSEKLSFPAFPHHVADGVIKQIDLVHLRPYEFGQGQIFSTLTDLHRLLKFLQRNEIGIEMENLQGVISKNGGGKGGLSQVYMDRSKSYGFIILSNIDSWSLGSVLRDSINIIEGKHYELPSVIVRKPVHIDREVLEAYVGTYIFSSIGHIKAKFEVIDDMLHLIEEDGAVTKLSAQNSHTFFEPADNSQHIEFVVNGNEVIAILHISGFQVVGERIGL